MAIPLGLLVVALAGAGAFLAWLLPYRPLETGSGLASPGTLYVAGVTTDEDGHEMWLYRPGRNRSVEFAFDVYNKGPFAVRVRAPQRAAVATSYGFQILRVHVGRSPSEGATDTSATAPTVPPDAIRLVTVRARLPTCRRSAPGIRYALTRIRLRYTYLRLFSDSATLELPAYPAVVCVGRG